jgi:hypothetical protein
MCLVSDSIKFCTCANGSISSMDCYWILIRLGKSKEDWVMGEPIMPFGFLNTDYESNRLTLLKRLNESDAFDKVLDIQINDKLHIVFNNLSKVEQPIIYAYQYINGKWVEDEYDWFELKNHHHKKVAMGIIDKK